MQDKFRVRLITIFVAGLSSLLTLRCTAQVKESGAAGARIRRIIAPFPRNVVTWDATTDMGKPVAPGTYTTKGIFFTTPPTMKYVMEVGKSGNPPWRTSDVREGDLRVILARVKEGGGDKDFQQGFWQIKTGGENGRAITSPAATVHFDQIKGVPGLRMAYKVGEKDSKTGLVSYTVEAAIPLTSLGLSNPSGKSFGFDASVGIANAAGDRRERAAHWGGLSEAVVVDRPGSTRLLPSTWGTLFFSPPAHP